MTIIIILGKTTSSWRRCGNSCIYEQMGEIMVFVCSDRDGSDEWGLGRGQHQMVTAADDDDDYGEWC